MADEVGDVESRPTGRLSTMLVVAVLALLLFTIGAYATVGAAQRDGQGQAAALQEARLLAREIRAVWQVSDGDTVEKSAEAFSQDGDAIIHVLDMSPGGSCSPDSYEMEALAAIRAGQEEYYGLAAFDGEVCLRYVCVASAEASAVSVVVPMKDYLSAHDETFLSYAGLFVILAVELVCCIEVALHKLVSRPLEQLSRAAHAVGDGDIGGKLGSGVAFGEVASLKRDLDDMEAKLKESHEQLEERVRERTSELEEANRRLKEEVEYKTTFLSTMSHELRTPLAAINAYADVWLRSTAPRDMEDVKLIQGIKQNSKSLLSTINNTLDAASIEAHRFSLDPVAVDLLDVVNAVDSVAAPLAAEKRIDWTLESSEDLPLVFIDPNVLHKIVMNLVGNAIKFTGQGGSVTLGLSADIASRRLTVLVRDTGIGIPPEDLQTIFERFRQADSSISRKYGGSGLGLSLVREMSELMGGTIDVQSKVGEGSTFTVVLPFDLYEEE